MNLIAFNQICIHFFRRNYFLGILLIMFTERSFKNIVVYYLGIKMLFSRKMLFSKKMLDCDFKAVFEFSNFWSLGQMEINGLWNHFKLVYDIISEHFKLVYEIILEHFKTYFSKVKVLKQNQMIHSNKKVIKFEMIYSINELFNSI